MAIFICATPRRRRPRRLIGYVSHPTEQVQATGSTAQPTEGERGPIALIPCRRRVNWVSRWLNLCTDRSQVLKRGGGLAAALDMRLSRRLWSTSGLPGGSRVRDRALWLP